MTLGGSSYRTRKFAEWGFADDANLNALSAILYAQSVSMPELEVVELPLLEALGDIAHRLPIQILVPARAR